MTSLWLAERPRRRWSADSADEPPQAVDCVVAGAGITGLITAVLLARAGRKVIVVEARTVGACATGNTTGKISLLQGTRLSKIVDKHGPRLARGYVDGNHAGQRWLLDYCRDRGVAVQREDAYTYAQSKNGLSAAHAEYRAGKATGLPVEWDDHAAVPFAYRGGVRLAAQAQFDPMALLDALAAELVELGGYLVEGARVAQAANRGADVRVTVNRPDGDQDVLRARQLVLATGIPILDRGGYFARVQPSRSYCLAFRLPDTAPRAMMISTDAPTRSVRYAPTADGERLIVGGAGHTVGRATGPSHGLRELAAWAVGHWPGAVQTHCWSAQDYHPADELPYVGPILPNDQNIFVATGFSKWGMTNGAAAALVLAGRMLGERVDWADAFASWSPHELSGLASAARLNLEVAANLAKGWVAPTTRLGCRHQHDGDYGVVSGPPWHLVAESRVDGVERRISPVCTHIGGVVGWNDVDRAWECPLHGSRFAPDGTLLEGPATRDLPASG